MRNNKEAANKFRFFIEKNLDIYTSSINMHELIEGANLSNDIQGNLEKVNALANILSIFPFDKNSAYISGKISAKKEVREKPIGQNDIFIASIAIHNKLKIVIKNKYLFLLSFLDAQRKLYQRCCGFCNIQTRDGLF